MAMCLRMMLFASVLVLIAILGLSSSQKPPRGQKGPCAAVLNHLLAANLPEGTLYPTCTDGGWYNYTQCHNTTGYCWCAFPESGKTLNGTLAQPGEAPECPRCLIDQAADLPDPTEPKTYVPDCDENGNYAALQVNTSTGSRWCVEPETGLEIPNTRTGPGQRQRTSCFRLASRLIEGVCEKMRESGLTMMASIDAFAPECSRNGWFEAIQCHESGMCWCVNPRNGLEVNGTMGLDREAVACGACHSNFSTLTRPYRGAYVPQCDEKGSTGIREACEDPCLHGKCFQEATYRFKCTIRAAPPGVSIRIVARSCGRRGFDEKKVEISLATGAEVQSVLVNCMRTRAKTNSITNAPTPVGLLPCHTITPAEGTCGSSGWFSPIQCDSINNNKTCWCVDPTTGEEVSGSRRDGDATCGKCHTALASTLLHTIDEYSMPQCNDQGDYKTVQVNISTDQSWCVDANGIEIRGTRQLIGNERSIHCDANP